MSMTTDEEMPTQLKRWREFDLAVEEHILNYVIPQYGDEGKEPAVDYDFDDCIKQAERYLRRAKTNQRPEGLERDMRKAAHWIQKAWSRLPDEQRTKGRDEDRKKG